MEGTAGGEWMRAPAVPKQLGVQQNTVYALVDAGELVAEITVPTRAEASAFSKDSPQRRR